MGGCHMSDKLTPTLSFDDEPTEIRFAVDVDIVIDIMNGKHVFFNFDPLEWVIVLGGVSLIIFALGKSGLI
jgi:hypothetical protein